MRACERASPQARRCSKHTSTAGRKDATSGGRRSRVSAQHAAHIGPKNGTLDLGPGRPPQAAAGGGAGCLSSFATAATIGPGPARLAVSLPGGGRRRGPRGTLAARLPGALTTYPVLVAFRHARACVVHEHAGVHTRRCRWWNGWSNRRSNRRSNIMCVWGGAGRAGMPILTPTTRRLETPASDGGGRRVRQPEPPPAPSAAGPRSRPGATRKMTRIAGAALATRQCARTAPGPVRVLLGALGRRLRGRETLGQGFLPQVDRTAAGSRGARRVTS